MVLIVIMVVTMLSVVMVVMTVMVVVVVTVIIVVRMVRVVMVVTVIMVMVVGHTYTRRSLSFHFKATSNFVKFYILPNNPSKIIVLSFVRNGKKIKKCF